jgi:choline-glycine betaine transporter
MLSTENVIFEQLASYGDPDGGGPGFNYLITGVTLACIALYFVTSSDSASFLVDMLAANGIEHPPMPQKVFWCVTEGLAACALLGCC